MRQDKGKKSELAEAHIFSTEHVFQHHRFCSTARRRKTRLEDVLIVCRERGVHSPLVPFLRQQLHDDSERKKCSSRIA